MYRAGFVFPEVWWALNYFRRHATCWKLHFLNESMFTLV